MTAELMSTCARGGDIISTIEFHLGSVMTIVKSTVTWSSHRQMYRFHISAGIDWEKTTDPKYIKIMNRYAKICRRLYNIQIWNLTFILTIFMITPITTRLESNEIILPMPMFCRFANVTEGWRYVSFYALQAFQVRKIHVMIKCCVLQIKNNLDFWFENCYSFHSTITREKNSTTVVEKMRCADVETFKLRKISTFSSKIVTRFTAR